ncbi:S-layer homology domain-containing protein [Paenibacillus sp. 2TAB19]|uniref:S-layer homology domain-containing protein n=1 Tax=Paenibacillus sp. 2TAB19 TaxID=3233003 RepID=UPI003F999DFD
MAFLTKQSMWKKTAITSLALMMLTGGATAAFADNGRGNGGGRDDDRNSQNEDSRHNDKNDDKDDDKYKVVWKFKDEDDLKWATEYIMRLASKGIFTGYDDGTFKPSNKITRIEAISAAVRLMGLRDQAESAEEMSTELQFKDADKIKKKYPWAVGYVSVALENDLFFENETEVKPEQQATRLWSTILLIKALKLEDEAKALNNTKLDFKDANQIPAASVGYVALALEKKIITGYEDRNGNKTFRPNQPITRAEIAVLLDRTDEEMPDQDATAITGTLKAAASGGKITVVKADKTEVVLTLDPNVFIFRDDKKAAVSALRAGDEVLVRTYQSKVVFIEVTEEEPEVVSFSETGKVQSLTFDSSAKLSAITVTQEEDSETNVLIYAVSPNVKIVGNASLLKQGQSVKVTGKNAIVETIEIK